MSVKLVFVRKRSGEVEPKKILMKKKEWPANLEADENLEARVLVPDYKVDQEV